MKTIRLTKGKTAIIDDEDFQKVNQYRWYAYLASGNNWRARTIVGEKGKRKGISMHRLIMGFPKGLDIDHINGNTLDNRKANMRVCTKAENGWNREAQRNNKSGYKGVFWYEITKRWMVSIQVNGKQKTIGYFKDKLDAVKAYNKSAKKYHGGFARLNKVF